jgi:hypothetical protein
MGATSGRLRLGGASPVMLCRGVQPYGRMVPRVKALGGARREDRMVLARTKRVHVTNARDSAAFANTPKGTTTPRELLPVP